MTKLQFAAIFFMLVLIGVRDQVSIYFTAIVYSLAWYCFVRELSKGRWGDD